LNIINLFKTNKDIQKDTKKQNIEISDNLILELSYTYISYSLNDEKQIKTSNIHIQEDNTFDSILTLWLDSINHIVKSFEKKPSLTILFKSCDFIVKNSHKTLNKTTRRKYFSNKMALEEESIEVINLVNNSYLIIEYKFLKQILFKFKDYTINNIYDLSLLNSSSLNLKHNHFYIDISFSSCDKILSHTKIQKRSFSNNLLYLIENCAKSLYVDNETSYQNLKLDFKNILTYDELVQSTKPLKQNLLDFCDKICDDVKNSLSYFSIYDNIEYIDKFYINGDILELDFIIRILEDKLKIKLIGLDEHIKINSLAKTNLTFYKTIDANTLKKQHINFDGLNYIDNIDEYVVLQSNKKTITKQNLALTNKQKRKKKQNIPNKPIWKMDMEELASYIKQKFQDNQQDENIDKKSQFGKLLVYGIGWVMLFFSLLFTINYILDTSNEFKNSINTLEDRIQRVDKLKRTLKLKNKQFIFNNLDSEDKIFWTQKIITLANLMPNEIWLSSVSMENITTVVENKEVTKQVLILEARAFPSAIGHIANIAKYMDKLLNADDDFRKDFSDIHFGGASIVQEYDQEMVEFKLLCNFEKNIHIKEVIEKNKKTNKKSIVENLGNIRKNTNKKEKILNEL
jgi:hypothetical protein